MGLFGLISLKWTLVIFAWVFVAIVLIQNSTAGGAIIVPVGFLVVFFYAFRDAWRRYSTLSDEELLRRAMARRNVKPD